MSSSQQVYLATGQLLNFGGLTASPSVLLSVASSELMSISPEAAKSSTSKLALKPSASVLNRFGLQKKQSAAQSSNASFSTSRDTDASTNAR